MSDASASEHEDASKVAFKRSKKMDGLFQSLMKLEDRKLAERDLETVRARIEESAATKKKQSEELAKRRQKRLMSRGSILNPS